MSVARSVEDRRRSQRVDLASDHGPLVTVDLVVKVREASAGGFSVETQIPLPVGSEHTFRFQNQAGQATTVVATCRHCLRVNRPGSSSLFVAGFEFVPQPAENLRLILETISALL
jgi:hypothetical protein